MTDVWVCSTCHSINRQRVGHCYKCGAPQEEATGELAHLREEQALVIRTVAPYRPTIQFTLAAALLLIALAAFQAFITAREVEFVGWAAGQMDQFALTGQLDEAAAASRGAELDQLGLLRLVLIVPALLAFGAWLFRVVGNVPALGGGLMTTSPTSAFVWSLLPVVNFRRIPGIIQDVLYRLDPKAGGVFMIAVAWIGLVGSWIVSLVVGWWVNLRLTFDAYNAGSVEEFVTSVKDLLTIATFVDIATTVMIVIGALVLVMVMFRIEARSTARDREIQAAATAGSA